MTGLVIRKESKEIRATHVERIQVICPACGQQVEAVAVNGRVKGYCAIAKHSVDFLTETEPVAVNKRPTDGAKAKKSAGLTLGRNSSGRFVKGNVPKNKKA
jgi:hypothetical protein